jgi:hypothetical protein
MCEMLDHVCDINRGIFSGCPKYWLAFIKLSTQEKVSNCYQLFTNVTEICSTAVSISIGGSNHNLVAISRKTNILKAGPNKRPYKRCCSDSYVEDVKNIHWSVRGMRSNQTLHLPHLFNCLIQLLISMHSLRKWLEKKRWLLLRPDSKILCLKITT